MRGFDSIRSPARPAVIDSWLVDADGVRSFDAYVERFATACAREIAIPWERTTEFMRAAAKEIPTIGTWFPRVEVTASDKRFDHRLRPAPTRGNTIRLWTHNSPDRRLRPDIKGADLDWLAELRRRAEDDGAYEA